MFTFLRALFSTVGAAVVALWILGALGLGDFRLYFGPVGTIECNTGQPRAGSRAAL